LPCPRLASAGKQPRWRPAAAPLAAVLSARQPPLRVARTSPLDLNLRPSVYHGGVGLRPTLQFDAEYGTLELGAIVLSARTRHDDSGVIRKSTHAKVQQRCLMCSNFRGKFRAIDSTAKNIGLLRAAAGWELGVTQSVAVRVVGDCLKRQIRIFKAGNRDCWDPRSGASQGTHES